MAAQLRLVHEICQNNIPIFGKLVYKSCQMKHGIFTWLTLATWICCGCGAPALDGGWAGTDRHFTLEAGAAPHKHVLDRTMLMDSSFTFPAWRGEKTSAQAVLWSARPLSKLKAEASDLKSSHDRIPASCIQASFVKYVMADVLKDGFGQCGYRPKGQFDSLYVADIIAADTLKTLPDSMAQPLWVKVAVPSDAAPGTYSGTLKIKAKGTRALTLPIRLEVIGRILPEPSEWAFHLDLWQNPYAVARYYGVEPWSDDHFRHMEPVMKMLADAGQKVATATIMDKPWNGQTEDAFGSMVKKIKNSDGSWSYDFSIFDRWAEFMSGIGIDRQINCYTMIPWKMTFDYVNGETGETEYFQCTTSSHEYREYWGSFIKAFAIHLKEKGLFSKTAIAMDERPEEDMKNALDVIREAAPDMKVSLAGSYHKSLVDELYDYCVALREDFPADEIIERRAKGLITTYYTCCAERVPNTFLASEPAEAEWIGWFAAANGYDGYLRWAYNSWTADPMKDARFRTWPAGDCFMVYPDGYSSPHFERLIEGVQDYEKVRILKEEWRNAGDAEAEALLNEALMQFTLDTLLEEGATPALNIAKALINQH